MFSSFDSTKAVIGIIVLGRNHCLLRLRHRVKCGLDYFFGLFFDRFLDPFLDHWGSTPLVLREGIMFVSKKTRRQIRHHVCLTDVMSQTHPIYACAGNNHARHLISSQCISLQLEARAFKVTLEKKT